MAEQKTPEGGSVPDAPTADTGLERRAFVRRMGADTVGLAGRIFGASRALTRASVAAGQAVRDNFEVMAGEPEAPAAAIDEPAPPAPAMVEPVPSAPAPPPTTVWQAPKPTPPAPFQLSSRQQELLSAATEATIAVNGMGAAPLVGIVPIHWDGETVRFASLGWSRRMTAVRADPRVSILVDDVASGDSVWLEGTATVLAGPALRAAMDPLLPGDDEAARDAGLAALLADDIDRAVISVTPTKALPGRARR